MHCQCIAPCAQADVLLLSFTGSYRQCLQVCLLCLLRACCSQLTMIKKLTKRGGAFCPPSLLAIYAVQVQICEGSCPTTEVDPGWCMTCI